MAGPTTTVNAKISGVATTIQQVAPAGVPKGPIGPGPRQRADGAWGLGKGPMGPRVAGEEYPSSDFIFLIGLKHELHLHETSVSGAETYGLLTL